jgi:hypothetical protein
MVIILETERGFRDTEVSKKEGNIMNHEDRKKEYRLLLADMFSNKPKLGEETIEKDDPVKNEHSQIMLANRNLLKPLRESELQQLKAGDGDELNWKLRQINSSSALAINVFHAIHEGNPLTIEGMGTFTDYELEKKLPTVVNHDSKANIDLHLVNAETHLYVESKFTEMFNKHQYHTELIAASYTNEKNHIDQDSFEGIKPFLFHSFQYFDGVQILRHAVGMYRDVVEHPELYTGKKVVLLNLVWELKNVQNRFPILYDIQVQALAELNHFALHFNKSMKAAFKKRGVDFTFLYQSYEDFIHHGSNLKEVDPETYEYVVQRYLFQLDSEVSMKDHLKYLLHSLPNQDMQVGFIDELRDTEIIEARKRYNRCSVTEDESIVSKTTKMIIFKQFESLKGGIAGDHPNLVYSFLNSANHHRTQFVLCLRESHQSALNRISDSILWNDETILLESLFTTDQVIRQESDSFGWASRSGDFQELIHREKEIYPHDFSRLDLQPFLFDEARRAGQSFVLGFTVNVNNPKHIYYARNKNGQKQLYQVYYFLHRDGNADLNRDVVDLLTQLQLETDDMRCYRKGPAALYRYLSQNRKHSDYNIFPSSPIVKSIDDSIAFTSFMEIMKTKICNCDSVTREELDAELSLFTNHKKLEMFYYIDKLINHLKDSNITYRVTTSTSFLWNLLFFGNPSPELDYPFEDIEERSIVEALHERLLKGTFDDGCKLFIEDQAAENVMVYIKENITPFRARSVGGEIEYLLVDNLETLLEITPFVQDTTMVPRKDKFDLYSDEYLLSPKNRYDYNRYWSRITVRFETIEKRNF